MALSGVINGTTSDSKILCMIEWSAEQSIIDNSSIIYAQLLYYRTDSNETIGRWSGNININGVNYVREANIAINNEPEYYIGQVIVTVPHNADGTKTITISATGAISGTTLTSTNISATITLDTINRAALITAATNFNDEDNPTITYLNNIGDNATTLQACISLTGANDDIKYRNIPKTGTTYTFNLTDAERNILRNATSDKTRSVIFVVKTVVGGKTYKSNLTKTFSITNALPEITASVIDSNSATIALTGDSSTLVRYYSKPRYTMAASAKKGASITELYTYDRDTKLTDTTGVKNYCDGKRHIFYTKDSRGFSTNKSIETPFIEYIYLTCNLSVSIPTAAGDTTLNIDGAYFNDTFGAVSNTLTIQYRYAELNKSYGEWITITPTISGNSYSKSVNINGLNYQTPYKFQARAIDKLDTRVSGERRVKSEPVFDWGANDMSINVPLSIQGRLYGTQEYLHIDAAKNRYFLSALSVGVDGVKYPNGILVVFVRAESGVPLDEDYRFFFVPKEILLNHTGSKLTFTMASSNFEYIASKTIYVYEGLLNGDDSNNASGTANGITYDNSKFIFRGYITL